MHARMICCTWLQCIRRQLCAVLLCCVAYIALPVSAAWAYTLIDLHVIDNRGNPVPNATVWLTKNSPTGNLASGTTGNNGKAVLIYFGQDEGLLRLQAFKLLDSETREAMLGVAYFFDWQPPTNLVVHADRYPPSLQKTPVPRDTLSAEAGGKNDVVEVRPSVGRIQISGLFNLDPRSLANLNVYMNPFDPLAIQSLPSGPATVLNGVAIVGLEVRKLQESNTGRFIYLEIWLGDEPAFAPSAVAISLLHGESHDDRGKALIRGSGRICYGGGEGRDFLVCPIHNLTLEKARAISLVIAREPGAAGTRTVLNARARDSRGNELGRLTQGHPFISGPLQK